MLEQPSRRKSNMAEDEVRAPTGTRRATKNRRSSDCPASDRTRPRATRRPQGGKPGERIVRLQRPSERRFRTRRAGTLRATDVAPSASDPDASASGAPSAASCSARHYRRKYRRSSASPRSRRWPSSPPTRSRPALTRRTKSLSCSRCRRRRSVLLGSDRPGDRPAAGRRRVLLSPDDQGIPHGGGAYIVARENLGEGPASPPRRRLQSTTS